MCLFMNGIFTLVGFGTADSQSLPFPGVARRVNVFFPGSSLGERSLFTRVKFISHKRVSNAASVLCGARPDNYRRNPDFNEDRDSNDEGPDESDILDSKNGTLFSSTSSIARADAVPGQTEKEILEYTTRKIVPRLRERTAGKDVRMDETVKGKDNEVVESILNLLRSDHLSRASKNGRATLGQKAASGTRSEGRGWNPSILSMKKLKAIPVIRPASSFPCRSPVPSENQPMYNSEDGDYDFGEKQQQELDEESESDEVLESEQERDNAYIFYDMAKGERSEEENSLDEGDQQPTEHEDLGSLKFAELRGLAKSRGMKGFSKMKKSELVELLSGN